MVEVNWKVLTYAWVCAGHAVNKSSKNAKKPGEKHYLLSGFWFLNIVFFSRVCTKHLCVVCCWRMMQLQLTSPRCNSAMQHMCVVRAEVVRHVWSLLLIYLGWIVRLLAAVLHVLVVGSLVLVVFCCWQTVVKAEHNGGERKSGEQQYLSRSRSRTHSILIAR